MANIANEAEQVIKECCKETDGFILAHPRKSVDFQKRFWVDDTTTLQNGTKIIREFYVESDWSGLVNLVMRIKNKPDGKIRLAMFDTGCLTCKSAAKAMEAIIETQFAVK